ncbi:putative membrane protein [Pyrobaculum oguniense TE7]|uniref:Membrane protein n=1 Tax=Pyrobaculum oguniense (strain DSM 13380 / JCM 10595 / TE7) TaxID=698757 RepID=H6QAZ3_PYROT|nr:putative membrane protein [Pyrobaculum oguniense TE7]
MDLVAFALILIFAGFALIVLSLLVAALRSGEEERGKAEAGGVVLIGPVPIVFGTSEGITKLTLILAVALTAMALLVFLLPIFR